MQWTARVGGVCNARWYQRFWRGGTPAWNPFERPWSGRILFAGFPFAMVSYAFMLCLKFSLSNYEVFLRLCGFSFNFIFLGLCPNYSIHISLRWELIHLQTINLIPYNPATSSSFKPSSHEDLTSFQKILRGLYGIRTTIRQEMGQDIAGACGQLVISQSVKQIPKVTDIEELGAA